MLPAELSVALKEWDVVCRALGNGQQLLLLRKGGIIEAIGGFELEQRQFVLFPTFLHQNEAMVKPAFRAGMIRQTEEPETITIDTAAEVTDILRVGNRAQMDRLIHEHIWEPPLIDMRFNYRPKNPLYLLLVRAYRLADPSTIQNTPDYAGCKSWVQLTAPIDCRSSRPVLDDADYEPRRAKIRAIFAE